MALQEQDIKRVKGQGFLLNRGTEEFSGRIITENGVLTAVFRGECSKCLILERCLSWIECEIKRDLGVEVKVRAVRKKPYFQDV